MHCAVSMVPHIWAITDHSKSLHHFQGYAERCREESVKITDSLRQKMESGANDIAHAMACFCYLFLA
ncbi:hypothetical protein ASG68_28445 [Rhizobium sp. Leaf453]|nr:hypothetical protein ASG50_16265 [Rhizobium sp. Leaf386]KQT05167.1 hypothetical protein ASG42_21905 [Rhizobium sp. Leaf391]KQU02162.1 hypothetical protein ASG68_28445 [Rhizobium sp. Leaf453]